MSRNLAPPITKWYRYRVWALFTLALYSIRYGISYTPVLPRPVRVPAAVEFITAIFPRATDHWQPIWTLGIIWMLLGMLALAAIVRTGLHNWAFIGTASFTMYWTLAYFINQFTPEATPGMGDAFSAVFLLVAFLWITLIGLLTRPASGPDSVPRRRYREDAIGENHVV